MAKEAVVRKLVEGLQSVFWSRHIEYGTAGMTMEKAISLAETKLDRIKNGGALEDSALDLAGYALIISLLATGQWEGESYPQARATKKAPQILVKRLGEDGGIHAPKKPGDVGFDLECSEDFTLPPHGTAANAFIVPAGVSIKTPEGYYCQIVGRSSAAKRGIGVQTAVIDTGYTGPMFACVWNMTSETIQIKKGDRIAQVVFFPSCTFGMEEVAELPETERGATGFGSTGK